MTGPDEKKVEPSASSNEEKKPDPAKTPEQPPTLNTNQHPDHRKLVEELAKELREVKDREVKLQERLDKLEAPPKKERIFKPGVFKGRPPAGRKS